MVSIQGAHVHTLDARTSFQKPKRGILFRRGGNRAQVKLLTRGCKARTRDEALQLWNWYPSPSPLPPGPAPFPLYRVVLLPSNTPDGTSPSFLKNGRR